MNTVTTFLLNFIHLPGIVIAFTLHEYVKAAASSAMGDPTPKNQKRLTLNPLKHAEPIGFLLLLFFGLGWGRPVETRAFGYKNRRRDELIVYILPSAVNIVIALACAFAARMMTMHTPASEALLSPGLFMLYNALIGAAQINLLYALFNIIPVYPLDGFKILSILRPETGMWLKNNERICQIVLMLLLCLGIAGQLLGPVADAVLGFAYGWIRL